MLPRSLHFLFAIIFGWLNMVAWTDYNISIKDLLGFFDLLGRQNNNVLDLIWNCILISCYVIRVSCLSLISNMDFDIDVLLHPKPKVYLHNVYFIAFRRGVFYYILIIFCISRLNEKEVYYLMLFLSFNYSSWGIIYITTILYPDMFYLENSKLDDGFITISCFFERLCFSLDYPSMYIWYVIVHILSWYLSGYSNIFTNEFITSPEYKSPNALLAIRPELVDHWAIFFKFYFIYKLCRFFYLKHSDHYLVIFLNQIFSLLYFSIDLYIDNLIKDYYYLKFIKSNIKKILQVCLSFFIFFFYF